MAGNNQLSGNTKNSSTGTSSTNTSSEAIGKHENEIVPHKISNHDKLVQTMVMVDGEWVNVNDTNDQANMKDDMNKVNKKVVEAQKGIVEAKNAADSAAKAADSAVSASVVNSDAITAQSEAVSEAKSAISSATAEIQQTAATAASDAAKIRADVAQVQSEVDTAKAANSATVEALKSDVSAAKQDIQAARQANENVAKQLDDYTKQAQAQGKTIKDIQNAQDGYTATLADVKGNVSKISDAVDGLSASLKDDQDNVATIKAKADELSATLTDHDKNIAQLTASAKELSSTLEDADGRLSKVEQTAATLTNEFADQQGHLNRVEQTAQGTEQTVANQQGQINSIQTDAAGIHETLTGQGDQIANINVTLNGLNTKYEGVSGDLGKLKSSTMQNRGTVNAPDFNTLTQAGYYTVTNPISGKNYPIGNWGTLEVSGQTVDGNGRLNQKYVGDNDGGTYTRQYNANTKSWTAWIKTANQNEVTALSNRITTNSTQITQNQQAIALKADQATVNNLSGEVSQAQAQLKVQADQISSKVSSEDFNTLDNKVNGMKIGTRNLLHNTSDQWRTLTNDGYWLQKTTASSAWTPTDDYHGGDEFTYTAKITNNSHQQAELEVWLFDQNKSWINGQSFHAPIPKGANAYDAHVTFPITVSTSYIRSWIIFTGGYAPHGDQIQVKDERLVRGNLAGTWEANPDDTIDSIKKNTTAINQTNKQISLKADQTEVDKVKQTATQNSSRLNVMANEISSKVTSTDVNNIINGKGYATTSTVQSLITQKAGTINESITNLTSEMNTRNGVNLLKGTKDFSGNWKNAGDTKRWYTENWEDPNGNASLRSDKMSWYGYYQPIQLDKGEYTFSCYYYSQGNAKIYAYIVPGDGNAAGTSANGIALDSTPNEWHLCVVHFTVTKAGDTAVRLENSQDQVLHIASYKLEKGTVANPVWTPAPSDNATVTQVQSLTASIDGLQSTVASKADRSQITQLSNVIQSKVSTSDFTSKVSQLSTDINARVTKGDLLSQINVEAGRTLIQSNKIYFDADSFVMSPNSKAFIPSAFITDLSADKITSGTLDAGLMRVINLTADSIHGGTLDVGSMNVKNLSANDITTGTLTGIDIKAGDNDNNFELKGQNIHWNRKVHYEYSNGASYDSSNYAVIGQFIDKNFDYGSYAKGDALTIGDRNEIRMGLISTYQDVDGSSQLEMQHLPKIVITYDDTFNPYEDRHQAGSLHNKQQINIWTTTKEFLRVVKETGIEAHLDDTLGAKSTFNIQKDNCVGAYFGQGNGGNQINFNFGGDGCGFNVNGPLHVTGSKNSIVETRQGYLAINAYETAEYYFGDIGENNTGDTSQVVIGIDRIFNEVVNTDIQYQVFVTPYSNAHVWVEKRYNNRFIVKSDRPNAEFGWELKAKRKGYESNRLRRVNVDFNQMDLKGEN